MYCSNCGYKLEDNSKFCPKCDSSVLNIFKGNVRQDSKLLYILKPQFSFLYKLMEIIASSFSFLLLVYLMFFSDYAIIELYHLDITLFIGFVFIFIAFRLIFAKLQYNYLKYNFYNDKFEYKLGYLNKDKKSVKYENIREVSMKRNILERICGIGTIILHTGARIRKIHYSKRFARMFREIDGIYIHCVKNVEEEYKKIKEIVNSQR